MIRKKQAVMIVSIAVVSFLVGTSVATDGGNPWDRVWTAISELQAKADSLNATALELQDRVNTIEEESNQVRTMRFYEPNETIIPPPSGSFKEGAFFIWTPNNSTNNAILSIRCYFRYRSEPFSGGLRYRIVINDETVMSFAWLHSAEYKWTPVIGEFDKEYFPSLNHVSPNENSYTIRVQFACETTGYVKDINVLLEVADGLPASN